MGLVFTLLTLVIVQSDSSQNMQESSGFGQLANYQVNLGDKSCDSVSVAWLEQIGQGRAQAVGKADRLYVASGFDVKEEGKVVIETSLQCLDLAAGKPIWNWSCRGLQHRGQENFSGAPSSPQATPLLLADTLVLVTFDGQLVCLKIDDGKLVWKRELVDELGAAPVQFGFSSSPIPHPDNAGQILVQSQGERGGLYCLEVATGAMIWKAESGSFSYSTPIPARFGGISQLVVVTRNEVAGIRADSGTELWRYELPEPGLTNVPTPLIIDQQRLLVSGQGCQGTRCLTVAKLDGKFQVGQLWYNRQLPFFYSNWSRLNERQVIGCLEKFLVVFNTSDGEIVGRWRGFSDANLIRTPHEIFVCDGKGTLNQLVPVENGFQWRGKYKIFAERCWTPISAVAGKLLVRGGDQLCCLHVNQAKSLRNLLTRPKLLEFQTNNNGQGSADPVELIFATFQSAGQQPALELYEKFRQQRPSPLTVDARIELASAAKEQGLDEVAKMVLDHAINDFPNSNQLKDARSKLGDQRD